MKRRYCGPCDDYTNANPCPACGADTERLITIHFAASSAAAETVHAGPALCGAGYAARTERDQNVTAIFNDVTCRNCIRAVRASNRQEEQTT